MNAHIFIYYFSADNIVIDNSSHSILLIDFGLSCQVSSVDAGVPQGRNPVGAQTHMSPEKASSAGYDYRSDVWANICTLFHMLTGQIPWIRGSSDVGCLYFVVSVRCEARIEQVDSSLKIAQFGACSLRVHGDLFMHLTHPLINFRSPPVPPL